MPVSIHQTRLLGNSSHYHVDRDKQSAKFWLNPVGLARNLGFSPVELRRIQRMLKENEAILLEKWNARFGS